MNKIVIILALCLIFVGPLVTDTEAADFVDSYAFVGGLYDNNDGFGYVVGGAARISGGVWSISRGSVGEGESSIEPDIGYFVNYNGWRFGLLAGPGIVWVGNEDPVTYISGATGLSVGYINEVTGAGVIAAGRYKFAAEDYDDGWQLGAALVYGF